MFDPDRYVVNASVKENLIFGVADTDALGGRLEDHPYLVSVIKETGLEAKLLDMGLKVAETLIELFGDLAPNNPLLERMDLMAPEEMDTYRAIVRRAASGAYATIDAADRQALLRLAYGYIEPRQRHGLLDETLQAEIVAARKVFGADLPDDLKGAIEFYQTGRGQRRGERAGQRPLRAHRRHLRGGRRAGERDAARDDGRARPDRRRSSSLASPSISAAAPSACRLRSSRSSRSAAPW